MLIMLLPNTLMTGHFRHTPVYDPHVPASIYVYQMCPSKKPRIDHTVLLFRSWDNFADLSQELPIQDSRVISVIPRSASDASFRPMIIMWPSGAQRLDQMSQFILKVSPLFKFK